MQQTLKDFKVKAADGGETDLNQYQGKVVVVVNVASKCGFTPQYEGLEKLYKDFKAQGLVILGFPCNQFGAQEPGSDQEIQQFCSLNYGVSFPVFGKVDVNGDNAAPIYKWLKEEGRGMLGTQAIKWNFTKFLIGKDGKVIKRFAPTAKPAAMAEEIREQLIRG
jgi:glutathione peroxidase